MARKTTSPSYVLEFELIVNKAEAKLLDKKLQIHRYVYNELLGQALKRLHELQHLSEYWLTLKNDKLTKAEKSKIINELTRRVHFTEYDLQAYGKTSQRKFALHLGSNEMQKLATRAFKAVQKKQFGKAKKVHFKAFYEEFSTENKSNTTGLRFINNQVLWGDQRRLVGQVKNPKGLRLNIKIKKNDMYAIDGLQDRTKYIRILTKTIRGRKRYFVQLVQEGYPPTKRNRKNGSFQKVNPDTTKSVGLDLGTSTVAISSNDYVDLKELAPECELEEKKIRLIQRQMDRSKRTTNPQNYNVNGTVKKAKNGHKLKWNYSNNYIKLRNQLKDLHRKAKVKRKQSHNRLANFIISLGGNIYVETMHIKGLARRARKTTKNKKNGKNNSKKRFGKTIRNHAPAMLISTINQKLQLYGLEVIKINTYEAKASQYNHVTNTYSKKKLNDRWNYIDNLNIQRDMYSAYLIQHINNDLKSYNLFGCIDDWLSFIKMHNDVIEQIRNSNNKLLKWYIKKDKTYIM